jgi:hypothetical protein
MTICRYLIYIPENPQPKNWGGIIFLFCLNFHTSVDTKNSVFEGQVPPPELPTQ